MTKTLFTSESVTEGHPDKLCDQISDAVLDACLRQDPESRVAVECLAKTGVIIVAGEVTTKAALDIPSIARSVLKYAGYTKSSYGIDADTAGVLVHLEKQSPDIAQGVDKKEQGAGDQGIMFGFACDETPEFLPLPISLANRLARRLAQVRKQGIVPFLGPDGKTQVTIEYHDKKPVRIDTVLISSQHEELVTQSDLKEALVKHVINPVCKDWLDNNSKILINPTGRFVRGGPFADAGVTGRKIIVDTYGGASRHGGGAFSGKDPSKVDRSAAYAARYIAKNIVAAHLADKCEIQLAYAIGVAKPVSIHVETFGTGKVREELLSEWVAKHFPLKPGDIIREFDLKNIIYRELACYGHFGRLTPWEKLDKVEILQKEAEGVTQDSSRVLPLAELKS
ncbi:MAG TPA: methionine adenosyltransferase [Candidatus Nanoarchaeia archaeon]|nr:methionine adenosyltransferase [Candidatus Nanoarchaeia archaeon]